ncbi:hypothetical protein ACLOJK_012942 [Asimina triloba]
MAKFDAWPVFFKREFNRNWPFLVGFSVTFAFVTKFTLGLTGILFFSTFFCPSLHLDSILSSNLLLPFFSPSTEEDAKNSPYVQRRTRDQLGSGNWSAQKVEKGGEIF